MDSLTPGFSTWGGRRGWGCSKNQETGKIEGGLRGKGEEAPKSHQTLQVLQHRHGPEPAAAPGPPAPGGRPHPLCASSARRSLLPDTGVSPSVASSPARPAGADASPQTARCLSSVKPAWPPAAADAPAHPPPHTPGPPPPAGGKGIERSQHLPEQTDLRSRGRSHSGSPQNPLSPVVHQSQQNQPHGRSHLTSGLPRRHERAYRS